MNPVRKKRLYFVLFIIIGVALALGIMLYALQKNINFFYSPSQVIAGEAPPTHSFRLGGLVEKGSVVRSKKNLEVSFILTDKKDNVRVIYDGILPDLFREGQGIVAQGKLNKQGDFIASTVLAKHDENYMPPEVQAALDLVKKQKKNK